uniref:phosphoinositide 3-kinase adapter protein 1-like isoform X2 n=1 Tax=Pristiophorus japonicus TaxID=55135 RepID=UPI00398F5B49
MPSSGAQPAHAHTHPGTMSGPGQVVRSDVVIFYAEDAKEWSDYLVSLLTSASRFEVLPYSVSERTSFTSRDYNQFKKCNCLLVLLSPQLLDWVAVAGAEHGLQRILRPAHKVVVLFCGVTETLGLPTLFRDWLQWKQISCDDEPSCFTAAVEEAINESYSRDSGFDTTDPDSETHPQSKVQSNFSKFPGELCSPSSREHQGNTVKVLPDRLQCGVPQQIFVILKIKLDSKVKSEIDFSLGVKARIRVPAQFVNEYTLSANAPDMPPGLISLTIYSGDLKVSSATLIYYTDMEDIENLLKNTINPVEFMCQETADMLKTHLKEELCGNMEGEDDEDMYESMATVTKDILMKCSLNPGCDVDIYESMIEMFPPTGIMESTYESMSKVTGMAHAAPYTPDRFDATKDCMLRKFFQGSKDLNEECDAPYEMSEDVYDTVIEDDNPPEIVSRPPLPVPRTQVAPSADEKPYIFKVFGNKQEKRAENLYITALSAAAGGHSGPAPPPRPKHLLSRVPSSDYDPFAGMKTPGQRQLITLQEQVKLGMINVDEALLQFKEWQLNQKRRSDSFRYQQENLKKLRDSITRRQNLKGKTGKHREMEITLPGRPHDIPEGAQCGVYEDNPRFIPPCPLRQGIQRGMWNTGSTSSTASSLSSRSSTHSILSLSSGVEGDNEDNEPADCGTPRADLSRNQPPSLPPPRIPPRTPARSPNQAAPAPPVPPRGR